MLASDCGGIFELSAAELRTDCYLYNFCFLAAIVAFVTIGFVSLPAVSAGAAAAEKSASYRSGNPATLENKDAVNEQSDQGVGAKSDAAIQQKSDEKKSTQEAKEEEHKPADPDTGKSTLSPETMGLLPNPLEPFGIKFSATILRWVTGAVVSV
jgi:hypothetical protein